MRTKTTTAFLCCLISSSAIAEHAVASPTADEATSSAIQDAHDKYQTGLDSLIEKFEKAKLRLKGAYRETLVEAMQEASNRKDVDGVGLIHKTIRNIETEVDNKAGNVEPEDNNKDDIIASLKEEVYDLTTEIKKSEDGLGPVVAVWQWGHHGRKWGTLVLLEGGQFPASTATWKLEDGNLIFQWPNSNAPGGAWIDTLKLSKDRRTMSGTNQHGKIRLGGVLLGARKSWFEQ